MTRTDSSATPDRSYGGRAVADRRAERRERFRAAGIELFGTVGFANVTISGLCAEAGLSRRQFYEEYSGSEDLLTEIYDIIQRTALESVLTAIADLDQSDVQGLARAAIHAYLDVVAEDQRVVRCALIEIGGISATMEQHRVDNRDIWAGYIATLIASVPGTVTPDEYATTAYIGSMTAVVHRWATADPQPDREVVVSVLSDLLVRLGLGSD